MLPIELGLPQPKFSLKWPLMAALLVCFSAQANPQLDYDNIEYRAVEVMPGLTLLYGAGGNIGVVHSESGLLIIDDDYAQMQDKLEVALAGQGFELGVDSPSFVLNTHWHEDSTGNNETLGSQGAVIIAHENVRKRLLSGGIIEALSRTVPPAPLQALPVITFGTSMEVHWGEFRLELRHPGPAHTDGDTVVYFYKEASGTRPIAVHTGDVFFNGNYPYIDVSSGGSVQGVIQAVSDILAVVDDGVAVIPGYGELASKQDLQIYHDFLKDAVTRISDLKAAGKSKDEVVSAAPLVDYEASWGKGWLNTDTWINIVYDAL